LKLFLRAALAKEGTVKDMVNRVYLRVEKQVPERVEKRSL
jgi:hypothetical protein